MSFRPRKLILLARNRLVLSVRFAKAADAAYRVQTLLKCHEPAVAGTIDRAPRIVLGLRGISNAEDAPTPIPKMNSKNLMAAS